jgi:tetratricopeptide (TPR) repeat protein
MNLIFLGRYEQAASVLAEAYALLERAGVPKALAQYFGVCGFLKMRTGDPASARMHYQKALLLYPAAAEDSHALDILGGLADISWALGDLDAALAGFRETVALLRKSPPSMKSTLGFYLANLSGVLTERGEFAEALSVAQECLPMLKEWDYAWATMDHFALRAALAGRVANAARVAGFADSIFAAKEISRQPNEARARDRLQALLTEKLATIELEGLLAEGRKMTEDEACRRALED